MGVVLSFGKRWPDATEKEMELVGWGEKELQGYLKD